MKYWMIALTACLALACQAEDDESSASDASTAAGGEGGAGGVGGAGGAGGAGGSGAQGGAGGAGGAGAQGGSGGRGGQGGAPGTRDVGVSRDTGGQGGQGGLGGQGGQGGETPPDMGVHFLCPEAGPVTFETEDGVTLAGDFYPSHETGRGAILFHMIPPSNNRSNYPTEFIEALVERGFTVLNIDRRGAGDSGGVAREAYEGPNGRLDAVAARRFLLDNECGVQPPQVVMVGASNGTTSVLDYTVDNPAESRPAALVFLTGGPYTENQNNVEPNHDILDEIPIQFVYSTAEKAWSEGFEVGAPEGWVFSEYLQGAHGTRMFGAVPDSIDDVVEFLDNAVR